MQQLCVRNNFSSQRKTYICVVTDLIVVLSDSTYQHNV